MANYPKWVLNHKKKGTYINHTNGKYYLYAAHSERIKGTKKVKRICDGYLGRITEKDGLIPPKDKVSGDVIVFEYGLSFTVFSLCQKIYTGYKRSFKANADFVMVACILSFINGHYDDFVFRSSYLSVLFPDIDICKKPTDKQHLAIKRGVLMLQDTISRVFGDDMNHAMKHLQKIYKVKINNRYYLSKKTEAVSALKNKYKLDWED